MTDRKQRLVSLGLTVVLIGLNLIALNYLLSGWTTARIDLTEEGLFSISPATKRLLTSLDEDLTIYGYFSKRTHPKLSPLVPELVDLLNEYRAVSGGRIHVEIIDPGEDEEAEQEAADRFGVQSSPFRLASKYETGIVNAYFALVVKYGDQYERYGFQDLIDVELLPNGDVEVRLRNPEYDLTRAIKKVVYGFNSATDLFERIEQPVRLIAIMSPESLPEILSEVPEAVRTAAQELGEKGGDKFVYEEIDPSQDEAARADVEMRFGARPMSLGLFSTESFYLYGILEIEGQLEQLILTGESISAAGIREAIESSMRRYTPGFLKTVGVVTPDPPQIPPQLRMQMNLPPQPPPEFQEVKRFLTQEYQVKDVALDRAAGVPADVDVLLVLKPRNLTEEQLFNLDQYLMRGGRVVICAGNYEADFSPNGLNVIPVTTGLDEWLAGHGLSTPQSLVLDDRNERLPIPSVRSTPLGMVRTFDYVPYPYLVRVNADGFLNRDITASLDSVGIYWGSPVFVDEAATGELEVFPILQSSEASWTSDDLARVAFVDYEVPAEGTEPHLLAVALSGQFASHFAGRPAPGGAPPPAAETEDDDAAEEAPGPARVPLEESPETRLVLVGNAEFLSDFVARSIGQLEGGFFVENLRFVENLIDWTTQDNEMIGIRSRGLVSRRLEPVDKATEIVIELLNYLIPTVILLIVAGTLYWKRRHEAPMFESRISPGRPEGLSAKRSQT